MYCNYLADRIVENSKGKRYYLGKEPTSADEFSRYEMGMIAKVKSHVKGLKIPPPKNFTSHLYKDLGLKEGAIYVQFDMVNSYPSIALEFGLISEDIFNQINKIRKKENRLACLGAVSSKPTVYKLNENREYISEFKKKATNANFFNFLVGKLNEIIKFCVMEIDEGNLKAVYADALFFEIRKDNLQQIKKTIEEINLQFSFLKFRKKGIFECRKVRKTRDIFLRVQHSVLMKNYNKKEFLNYNLKPE